MVSREQLAQHNKAFKVFNIDYKAPNKNMLTPLQNEQVEYHINANKEKVHNLMYDAAYRTNMILETTESKKNKMSMIGNSKKQSGYTLPGGVDLSQRNEADFIRNFIDPNNKEEVAYMKKLSKYNVFKGGSNRFNDSLKSTITGIKMPTTLSEKTIKHSVKGMVRTMQEVSKKNPKLSLNALTTIAAFKHWAGDASLTQTGSEESKYTRDVNSIKGKYVSSSKKEDLRNPMAYFLSTGEATDEDLSKILKLYDGSYVSKSDSKLPMDKRKNDAFRNRTMKNYEKNLRGEK